VPATLREGGGLRLTRSSAPVTTLSLHAATAAQRINASQCHDVRGGRPARPIARAIDRRSHPRGVGHPPQPRAALAPQQRFQTRASVQHFPANYPGNYLQEIFDPRELHIGFFGRQNKLLENIYLAETSAFCSDRSSRKSDPRRVAHDP
jgi:hypothetical protein